MPAASFSLTHICFESTGLTAWGEGSWVEAHYRAKGAQAALTKSTKSGVRSARMRKKRRGCMKVGLTHQVPLEAGARSIVVQRSQVSKLHEDQGFCSLPLNLEAGLQASHDVRTECQRCAMPHQHVQT